MTEKERFARHLRIVARGVGRIDRRYVCMRDYTVQEFDTLRAVRDAPDATTSELARWLDVGVPTASRNLARMERGGYVRRERSESDRRRHAHGLTAMGRRVLASLTMAHEQQLYELLWRVPARERANVMRAVRVLAETLDLPGEDVDDDER